MAKTNPNPTDPDFDDEEGWDDVEPHVVTLAPGDVAVADYDGYKEVETKYGTAYLHELRNARIRRVSGPEEHYPFAAIFAPAMLHSRLAKIAKGARIRIEEQTPAPSKNKGKNPTRMFRVQTRGVPPSDIPF